VAPGTGRVESISAVTLVVSEMSPAVAFYRAIGFETLYGGPEATFTSFTVGDSYLNLQLSPDARVPVAGGWGRVIFWVDDVDAIYDRARAAGYEPLAPPADATWGERFFHIRDPDGHEISFARPLSRS
jgi:catechol 2,3-dioxygenase-like lactoylglutathione lyase family enzyme